MSSDANGNTSTTSEVFDLQAMPSLPPQTLNKIFQRAFAHPDETKTNAAALSMAGEYLKIFATEAVHRAVAEKKARMSKEGDENGAVMLEVSALMGNNKFMLTMLLQVEDLQAVAAQMSLDFS
ncbi:hypothetical protein YB2330_004369 [Saitoella coloradoensis]